MRDAPLQKGELVLSRVSPSSETWAELSVAQRGIARLCHFTSLENLRGILKDHAIRSQVSLRTSLSPFVANDPQRKDGHRECISLTVEYPNVSMMNRLNQYRSPPTKYVVLCVDPLEIGRDGALFSPVNAATRNGAEVRGGEIGFVRLFDPQPPGVRRPRGPSHSPACPTDLQAEVLLPNPVRWDAVQSVIVANDIDEIHVRARLGSRSVLPVCVEPSFFSTSEIKKAARRNRPLPIPMP
jgi:hypothetical protein